ncbi:MAG: 2-C-methyl-D-erythritol 4-phosphate cytidylyltransferase [Eubacterium sp.]|nr:2-C-methyl-D-erythritol 4-phosphate cytidylyltransferase [Eubacterium sp.]
MERAVYGAVVLAAGSGSRMNTKTAKQYLLLNGKPLIYYALRQFQDSEVEKIVLVVAQGQEDYCRKEIVERYGFTKVCAVVPGGSERYLSVHAGLKALDGIDYVLIHDGARPCVDQDILKRTMEEVARWQACVVGMPVKDTIKIVDEQQMAQKTPDRRMLWQVQTPQAFSYDLIRGAYDKVVASGEQTVTDDAQVLELALGRTSRLIEGSYRNIKVTTPEDLDVAQIFLKNVK